MGINECPSDLSNEWIDFCYTGGRSGEGRFIYTSSPFTSHAGSSTAEARLGAHAGYS